MDRDSVYRCGGNSHTQLFGSVNEVNEGDQFSVVPRYVASFTEKQVSQRRFSMKKLAILLACVLYVLSPVDIIPDPIVGLGQVDDIGAIVFAIKSMFAK